MVIDGGQQTLHDQSIDQTGKFCKYSPALFNRNGKYQPGESYVPTPVEKVTTFYTNGVFMQKLKYQNNLPVLYSCPPCSVAPCFALSPIYGIYLLFINPINQNLINESRLNSNIGIFISRMDYSINERNQFTINEFISPLTTGTPGRL